MKDSDVELFLASHVDILNRLVIRWGTRDKPKNGCVRG